MKSFLVIGLGNFGRNLASKLVEEDNEVMAVDRNIDKINMMADVVTCAQCGDCQNIEVLRGLGIQNYDACFVCISNNFQSSLEITYNLKLLNARYIVSKADQESQSKFLSVIGADEIVTPEKDMAERVAIRHSISGAFEYMQFAPKFGIFEIQVPEDWVGREVQSIAVRNKYNINIIGIKKDQVVRPLTDAEHVFSADEHLIIAGSNEAARLMMK